MTRTQRVSSLITVAIAALTLAPTPSPAQLSAYATAQVLGVQYLLENQNPDGTWGAGSRQLLTTAVAVQGLRSTGDNSPQVRRALAWLASSTPRTTEEIAHVILALASSSSQVWLDSLIAELKARQQDPFKGKMWPTQGSPMWIKHDDYTLSRWSGWGFAPGYPTNAWDTALAMEAIEKARHPDPRERSGLLARQDVYHAPQYADVYCSLLGQRYYDGTLDHSSWSPRIPPISPAARIGIANPINVPSDWNDANADALAPTIEATAAAQALVDRAPDYQAFWEPDFDPDPTKSHIFPCADLIAAGSTPIDYHHSSRLWLETQLENDFEGTVLAYIGAKSVGIPLTGQSYEQAIEDALTSYLIPMQQVAAGPGYGSWNDDPYDTALMLVALAKSGHVSLPDTANQGDEDGDGCLNDVDLFPFDGSECSDLDGDGIGDNIDPDRDGDGFCDPGESWGAELCVAVDKFPDDPKQFSDIDHDDLADAADADIDGDGYANLDDDFPLDPDEWVDTDGDGVGDNEDTDDDNDGIADAMDPCPQGLDSCTWNVETIAENAFHPEVNGTVVVYRDAQLTGTSPDLQADTLAGAHYYDFAEDELHSFAGGGVAMSYDVSMTGKSVVWRGCDPATCDTGASPEDAIYATSGPSTGVFSASPNISGWTFSSPSYFAWVPDGSIYFFNFNLISGLWVYDGSGGAPSDLTVGPATPLLFRRGNQLTRVTTDWVTSQLTDIATANEIVFAADRVAGENLVVCLGPDPQTLNCFGGDTDEIAALSNPIFTAIWATKSDIDVADGKAAIIARSSADPAGEVFVYDVGGALPVAITNDSSWKCNPQISANRVVWLQSATGCPGLVPPTGLDLEPYPEPSQVMAYDLDTGTTYQLTSLIRGQWLSGPLSLSGMTATWHTLDLRDDSWSVQLATLSPDPDRDRVADEFDNCVAKANGSQCDVDGDGYGNACDGDFLNVGSVGLNEQGIFAAAFGGTYDSNVDMEYCDGAIGLGDFGLFSASFQLGVPGPTSLSCAGTIPCEADIREE